MNRENTVRTGLSRRRFLQASLLAGGAALEPMADLAHALAGPPGSGPFGPPCRDHFAGGQLLAVVPFRSSATGPPFHVTLGTGLDARRFTDLSRLEPDGLITPNDRFFLRTAYPDLLDPEAPWTIRIGGLVRSPRELRIEDLRPHAAETRPYLMECAGNNDPRNFGLMSAARWSGIPLAEVLARAEPQARATRVLVSGFDRHSRRSRSSRPGASWIFTLDEIESFGAFLAVGMNGAPLPLDHGLPVRLIVPRWYGCACLKWVNEITFVDDSAPATDHMKEFAARTHQAGVPDLARDFTPAAMDLSAMPVRIEKWMMAGQPLYRVVGIMWGGSRATDGLAIRFNPEEPYVPVDVCPLPETTDTWSLWSHAWRPAQPGRYRIVLKVDDPGIPTRRLDMFFYTREVTIDET